MPFRWSVWPNFIKKQCEFECKHRMWMKWASRGLRPVKISGYPAMVSTSLLWRTSSGCSDVWTVPGHCSRKKASALNGVSWFSSSQTGRGNLSPFKFHGSMEPSLAMLLTCLISLRNHPRISLPCLVVLLTCYCELNHRLIKWDASFVVKVMVTV